MTKPAIKSFDLSVFDIPSMPLNQVGTVISIELSKVIEDPDQPRKSFVQEDLEKFAQEIATRGVQSPIQVKSLGQNGHYQIIQGARRYRASVLAGLKTIPAIVRTDEALFDEYSQVTENTQREDLSPLDIARFIAKRKKEGETNAQIAKNLNESKEYVSKHLALLEAPEFIQEALTSAVISGMQSAYHLFSLYKKNPEAAKQLLDQERNVTTAEILGALKEANLVLNDPNDVKNFAPGNSRYDELAKVSPNTAQAILDNSSPFALNAKQGASVSEEDTTVPEAGKIVAFRTKLNAEPQEKAEIKPKKPALEKDARLAIEGVVQNLKLQLGNKAAKQIIFSHSEARTLKALLEGLL